MSMGMSISLMSNSGFSTFQNLNSLTRLATSGSTDYAALNESEKRLTMYNLNNKLVYDASNLMVDSSKKVSDENIKRTFDTFA